jgi:hypothetical protein
MKLKLANGLDIRASPISGRGCFATIPYKRWRKIAPYAGEKITNAEAKRRGGRRILRICGIDHRWSLDGSRGERCTANSSFSLCATLSQAKKSPSTTKVLSTPIASAAPVAQTTVARPSTRSAKLCLPKEASLLYPIGLSASGEKEKRRTADETPS